MKSKQKYFVPLNVQRDYWQNDKPFVFLDKIFENQFSNEELAKLHFRTLPTFKFKYTKEEIDFFEAQLIHFFQDELNSFHDVNFDFTFWRKLFNPYLKNCITNIFSKVEELSYLVQLMPNTLFYTFAFSKTIDIKFLKECSGLFVNEMYNNYIFAKIGADYFDFKVVYEQRKEERKQMSVISEHIESNAIKKSFIKRLQNATFKGLVKYGFMKILSHFFKPQLLLWSTYFSSEACRYFFEKSHARIQELNIERMNEDSIIDLPYRQVLKNDLFNYFKSDLLSLEKKVVLDLLPEILPFFYIENFKKYLNAADIFLRKYKTVKCFFATCTYCRGIQPFLLIYAQEKGIKVLTEIHGGDYGIVANRHDMECFLDNTLYTWGTWGNDVFDTSCNIRIAPSYRQHLLYDNKKTNDRYILFLGSGNQYNISSWRLYLSGHSGVHNSIKCEVDFFKKLSNSAKKSMLVRNYVVDFGYHLNDILHSEIPELKIQNYLQSVHDGSLNSVSRNNSFAQTLLNCSLVLVNEFETCFVEALYCEKPFVVLFNKYNYPIRIEEIPYFKMMEDVGLLFYDWDKAALLINKIYNDIHSWWNEPERQKVVRIIRNRYSIKVPDIKKWWYKEFMNQIKISRKELKGRRR